MTENPSRYYQADKVAEAPRTRSHLHEKGLSLRKPKEMAQCTELCQSKEDIIATAVAKGKPYTDSGSRDAKRKSYSGKVDANLRMTGNENTLATTVTAAWVATQLHVDRMDLRGVLPRTVARDAGATKGQDHRPEAWYEE